MIVKPKIIWISAFIPYDTVSHAGAKIENYYIKKMIETNQFDLRLISFYMPDEIRKFTINKYIPCDLFCYHSGIRKIIRNLKEINYKWNPFHKYANLPNRYSKVNILKVLNKYKKEGYIPDLIILQWTQEILFAPMIKEIFPNTKVIAIEEDVALLAYKRRMENSSGKVKKYISSIKFKNIEREEINALKYCDFIILNNQKDLDLLKNYGIKVKMNIWSPYFDNYSLNVRNKSPVHSIIYYGAMYREENYLSVIWFIDYVMPLLREENINFVIIGSHPDERLKKYENAQIRLTGYVEDVGVYLRDALCMVVPLVLGAGIKIKVLEAMSAGIPVLTNSIGIEGIPAEDGKEFFFCESPEQYADVIKKLIKGEIDISFMEKMEKEFINEHFNYEKSGRDFILWVEEILSNR